jgi:hypothetical protein
MAKDKSRHEASAHKTRENKTRATQDYNKVKNKDKNKNNKKKVRQDRPEGNNIREDNGTPRLPVKTGRESRDNNAREKSHQTGETQECIKVKRKNKNNKNKTRQDKAKQDTARKGKKIKTRHDPRTVEGALP